MPVLWPVRNICRTASSCSIWWWPEARFQKVTSLVAGNSLKTLFRKLKPVCFSILFIIGMDYFQYHDDSFLSSNYIPPRDWNTNLIAVVSDRHCSKWGASSCCCFLDVASTDNIRFLMAVAHPLPLCGGWRSRFRHQVMGFWMEWNQLDSSIWTFSTSIFIGLYAFSWYHADLTAQQYYTDRFFHCCS